MYGLTLYILFPGRSSFSTQYPNVQFAWSYKTNYLNAICSIFHQEGSIAEVVSGFEYEKARSLGIPGHKIIFNGPHKSDGELQRAFSENAVVNIDSFQELYRAENVAKSMGKTATIGIRLNMDTGTYPRWYKFGFDLERNQAFEAVARISKSKWLSLSGLHAHIGTFMLDPKAYAIQVRKMIEFMTRIESLLDCTIDTLDIGGGFPSKNRLKGSYMPPEIAVPKVEEFADTICSTLLENLPSGRRPKLYLETGRHLIDEAGYLITSLIAEKQLPYNRTAYFLDSGITNLYTGNWYDFSIRPGETTDGIPEITTLYGPLCMNIDVVAESISLPPMSVGSPLVIWPVGAYNVTQWMQFITYRPAVVLITEEGTMELIRRREKLSDITTPEEIPEHLLPNEHEGSSHA
ncbi:alanine racemase [Chitinivibrio alkaliphilus]|uniref:Type III Pyridoxal 5-phosphate (PLP)-Dependent Enzymes superfamily protein n=1 Tax=Chitinivibrio alkaliphilus ACht1 TaxID=1313304 RepID=U7D8F2_9BACT|nr:alanine racemase [Chitinivibrio alkaliphilus]ERP30710.1 Type III Pyridoxal 5-phosphate (PLP)-Dependent Enzymes superfamily protein [Chitinivibrio alkaliphilus ACht1]